MLLGFRNIGGGGNQEMEKNKSIQEEGDKLILREKRLTKDLLPCPTRICNL